MRSVEFNYAKHRQRNIPLVPVSLRTGGKWSEVWAYVDSGSFYNLLGMDVLDRYRVTFDNRLGKIIFESHEE